MTERGTDHATEERQLRRRDEKEGTELFLQDVFFALGEVTFLGLPAFLWLLVAEPNAPLKYAALFSWATLSVAVGAFRGGRFGVAWPPTSPSLVVVRLLYYDATILAAAYAGAAGDLVLRSPVVTAAVAVVVSLAAALAFPRVAAAVDSRTPEW
ncbi:hypothetical protein [Halomicrococcus gelatinilyticus]|uniref:hypothetical protein n=1 Tax=Halomicrococcus gelatinilyticus TaxID=1702103 RepID=UPI002E11B790